MKKFLNLIFIILCTFLALNCQSENRFIGKYTSNQITEFTSPISLEYKEKRKDDCYIQLENNNLFEYACTISATGMGTTKVMGAWELRKNFIILNPKIDSVITIDKIPGYYTSFLIGKDSILILNNKQIKHQNRIFDKH